MPYSRFKFAHSRLYFVMDSRGSDFEGISIGILCVKLQDIASFSEYVFGVQ